MITKARHRSFRTDDQPWHKSQSHSTKVLKYYSKTGRMKEASARHRLSIKSTVLRLERNSQTFPFSSGYYSNLMAKVFKQIRGDVIIISCALKLPDIVFRIYFSSLVQSFNSSERSRYHERCPMSRDYSLIIFILKNGIVCSVSSEFLY